MARFLPSRSDPPDTDADPRVIGVDSDDAGELLAALSSGTARGILAALNEEPAAPSEVAERVGTSLQNAQYHLQKLADADLVHVAETVYSEKGREMKVYAPSDRPLVVFAGREEETTGLKAALSRLLGGLGVVGIAAVVIDRVAHGGLTFGFGTSSSGDGAPIGSEGGGVGGSGQTTVAEATRTTAASDGAATTVTEAARTTAEATGTVANGAADTTADLAATTVKHGTTTAANAGGFHPSPGLLFFAGGATVLLVGFALWYTRAR